MCFRHHFNSLSLSSSFLFADRPSLHKSLLLFLNFFHWIYGQLTHYTPPTESFGIMIEFALPLLTFIFNLCVIFVVRRSLKQEMPFSVRTRRRRQMHNYVLVWMFCWGPYLVHEIYFFCQTHQERHDPTDTQNKLHHMLFLIRNATLYSTGSFDLLIFGMEVCVLFFYE